MPQPTNRKKQKPFYLKRFKILIILLILVILLPGYFLILQPVLGSYQENKDNLRQYQQEREIKIEQLKNYKKRISVYQSLSSLEETKINEVLPNSLDEANLYINIESIVEEAGLTLTRIFIQPIVGSTQKKGSPQDQEAGQAEAVTGSQLEFVNIELNLEDVSYAKMKDLFVILETNLRLLDVGSFSFNADEGTLALSIKTYYLKQ